MIGFEPCDVTGRAVRLDLAEADKGMHLVEVAPHLLGHRLHPPHQRIGGVVQRLGLLPQAQQQRVKQSEALWVRMADGGAGEVDERPRHGKSGSAAGRCRHHRLVAEQFAGAGDLPA